MTEDELDFMPQAGATTSANAALAAAAMASARHRRQGSIFSEQCLCREGLPNEPECAQ